MFTDRIVSYRKGAGHR